ncbi:RluA family pseudouridine synthase [Methanimicrococcus blatticola]|uniref:RluA family pseudouridine synthase n=1 Tax=Methanimicrococcus blatticola TaxID=91560 RepID=UPI0010604960|nr:RluA family pseudouridine synthase [Methanimicrococcus blatticola]MBZ3935198.1 RluA family pseudouridine synthase [Methanimicrococcus blatticola]MCC2508705.1 RluA family pseudouridine synthase [Methanimicrococcus blatticola]
MKFDFEYKAKKNDEGLLIKELLKREKGVSAKLIQKIRHNDGSVFKNGEPAILIDAVNAGDLVQVKYPEGKSNFDPEPIPIDAVYEDDSFLAINKQPGVVIYPTKGQPNHTLANGIMKYMLDRGDAYKIRFINRLDMNTSGLILVGKNPHVQNHFITQGKQGGIQKIYRAIVCGIIEEDEGVIDLPIGKGEDNIKRVVKDDGSPSVTEYKVLERFAEGEGYSYVELNLITGRTHQIRVHMSH